MKVCLCVLCASAVCSAVPGAPAQRSQPQQQQRQAQLSWWDRSAEAKVGHYWIKTDLPPEEANALGRHLNIMYAEYSKRLASLPVRAEEKLNVLIFKSRDDYMLTLRARFGVNPTGSGGMFFVTSAGSGLAFWTENLPQRRIEHVIQHEGFHQFAYSRFGDDLPIWVNEGLAEFFGESVVVGDTVVIGQSTPRVIDDIKQAIELNKYIPFQRMLTMTPKQWSAALQDNTAALEYHQAWSMVHFLVYGDGGKYVGWFETYLRHLNNGLPSEEAFIRAFGRDIPAFESQWKKYALAAKPSAFVTSLERIEFLADGALELSKQNILPDSLDAMRSELQKIGFTRTINTHGVEVKLSADDATMYQIPMDDICTQQPAFVVEKAKLSGTRREKFLEEKSPTPPSIFTENLKPRSVSIKWVRDKETNEFSYQMLVR